MLTLILVLVAVLWAPCTSTWTPNLNLSAGALASLDLSSRNISVVPSTAFACLPTLETLILSDNTLSAVCDDSNSTVQCDDVSFNQTETFQCFAGLEKLQYLDLSVNNVSVLDSAVFSELGGLLRLNLSGNALQSLDSQCFAGLDKLEQLDLSRNLISVLESAVFGSMRQLLRLNMSRNSLESLDSKCFTGLEKLQQLDLSINSICEVEGAIFSDLGELLRLNMSGNRLETLSSENFRGLIRLQQLDASHNRITSVSPGTFQPVAGLTHLLLADNPVLGLTVLVGTGRKLQTVDASRAGLSQVPAALTTSIRTLRLAGNVVTAVRCGDLDSYPLLRLLDLSDNIILELEEDALGRLEVLTTLYLSGNKLHTVPRSLPAGLTELHLQRNSIQELAPGELQGLPRLKYLSLRESGLRVIQNEALGQLPALQTLDLSNNPLTRLPGNALSGPLMTVLKLSSLTAIVPADATELSFPVTSPERLEVLHLDSSPELARQLLADTAALAAFRQLRELDLSHANLTALRSDLFHFLPRLRVLRLAGNPLQCDHMLWLVDWIRHNQQELQDSLRDAVCASPDHLASTPVMNLYVTTSRYDDFNLTSLYQGDNATYDMFAAENITDFYPDDPQTPSSEVTVYNTTEPPPTTPNYTAFNQSEASKPLSQVNTDLYSVLTNKSWSQHKFFPSTRNRDTSPSVEPISGGSNPLKLFPSSKNVDTVLKKQTHPSKDLQKLMYQHDKSFNNIMQGDDSLVHGVEESIRDLFNNKEKPPVGKTLGNLTGRANLTETSKTHGNSSNNATSSNTGLEGENLVFENVTLAVGDKSVYYRSRASDAYASGVRVTVKESSLISGSHPGMFVLLGVGLAMAGALAVAMSHCAKKRRRQAVEYSRQQDIEVRSMSSIGDLW